MENYLTRRTEQPRYRWKWNLLNFPTSTKDTTQERFSFFPFIVTDSRGTKVDDTISDHLPGHPGRVLEFCLFYDGSKCRLFWVRVCPIYWLGDRVPSFPPFDFNLDPGHLRFRNSTLRTTRNGWTLVFVLFIVRIRILDLKRSFTRFSTRFGV